MGQKDWDLNKNIQKHIFTKRQTKIICFWFSIVFGGFIPGFGYANRSPGKGTLTKDLKVFRNPAAAQLPEDCAKIWTSQRAWYLQIGDLPRVVAI
jgi:hypothetical protein